MHKTLCCLRRWIILFIPVNPIKKLYYRKKVGKVKKVLSLYFNSSLLKRIFGAFVFGSITGGILWYISSSNGYPSGDVVNNPILSFLTSYLLPLGEVFVKMLKMVVIPVVFFSLIVGASSLAVNKFGRVGLKVIVWYFVCSLIAAVVGVFNAMFFNPGSASKEKWVAMSSDLSGQHLQQIQSNAVSGKNFQDLFLSMFQNPFKALADGNFLPIIVFAILLGLAIRVLMESTKDETQLGYLNSLTELFHALRDAMFKIVDWVLEYSPIGVFVLSMVNFAKFGPLIIGPYAKVLLGVVVGILILIFGVYSLLLAVTTRQNPFRILKKMEEAMLTAFVTRSSAATLPVSIKVAKEELKVSDELASFSLPLGATINMDGVCVHLPMFAILAANMFGYEMTAGSVVVLVITTVLASIGTGGVPGGRLMLLFLILESMGLGSGQIAVIVGLALGINPILDMFETMNNVTGDMVCSYAVAKTEGLIEEE